MKLTNYNPKLTNQTTNTSNTQTLKTKELTFFCLLSSQFVFSDLELLQVWLHVCLSRSASFSFLSTSRYTGRTLSFFPHDVLWGELSQVPFQSLHRTPLPIYFIYFFFIIKKIQNQNNGVPLNP